MPMLSSVYKVVSEAAGDDVESLLRTLDGLKDALGGRRGAIDGMRAEGGHGWESDRPQV